MENNSNKKIIRVESGSTRKPSDPSKKVVRRVVKVINEKDIENTDLKKEVALQMEAMRKKKLETQRQQMLKEQEELRKKQEEERRQKEEAERKKKEAEERQRLLREAQKRAEAEKREAEKQAELKRKEKMKELAAAEREKKRQIAVKAKEKKQQLKEAKREQKRREREQEQREPLKRKILKGVKIAAMVCLITGFSGCLVLGLILYSWCQDLPSIDISELGKSAQTSYIYDIDGELITTYSGTENREWVELKDMPEDLVNAFLSIEDKRFYEHGAIDIKRLGKAVLGQILGNDDSGGSTITQQLIKNVYLTNEVTYKRKMQEIVLAYQLEKQMSKDDILEAYLNIIYFGSSNYGVSAAARDYFDKSLDELTLREIAMLAGIPKNPNGYNPRRNTYVKQDMTSTNQRTDNVLWVMHNEDIITDREYEYALSQDVEIKEGSSFFEMYDNAHAVEYTMQQVVQDMLEERGLSNTYENRIAIDNEIRRGGYSIYTTIDPVIQAAVQQTIEYWNKYPQVLNKEGKAIVNDDDTYEKPQVASVVIDPANGHILAMIGSRDTPDSMKTLNRAVNSKMPVASTIKPLSIYAPCVESGLYPGSVEYNFKAYIEGYDSKASYPGGTSPEKTVTMREAIEHSYNISAVRFLVNNVGYELSEDYLIALGIDKESIQKNGAGLALGTSGINMLELTAAYQSLANGGWYYEPKGYTKVVDNKGNVVLDSENHQEKRQVFSEETAWLMTDMLTSTVEEGNSTGAIIKGIQVAGKTGTHEDKCAVFAGYTGEYVSCIWIGSDSFSNLSDSSGGRQAAPIWQSYMSKIYDTKGVNKETVYESTPIGITKLTLCADSGLIATDNCPNTFEDYGSYSIGECNMHVEAEFCKYSGMLVGDDCDENTTNIKNAMIIPANSSLASLPEEIIKKNWPNAIVESPENICNAHVNGKTIPTESQIGYSRTLQKKIQVLLENTLLEQQYKDLLNADYTSITNIIARAENALYNGVSESDNFYNEYFAEYNRVKTDINNIQAIIDNLSTIAIQTTTTNE